MEENQIIVDVGLDAFIASLRHLQKQYELNTAALKAMKDAGEEQSDAYIMLTQEQKVLRQQIASTEKTMQNEIKMQQAQEGSLVQLRAQLANLQKQYDSMSGMERMGEAGVALQKQIKSLHDEVLGLEGDTGRMQRNVGNYPAAVQPLREELERLTKQLEDLRAENKEGSEEFAAVEKRIGEVNQSITQLTGKVDVLATDTGNVKQQMRELTENLIAMKMRGEENTEQYRQMLEQLGKMKDAVQDTNAQVKQMASDTSALNSVLAGAQAAAGGFSVALGVMNLVGDKDSETAKELAEAQRKLQSAIAITTGLQALQNALQKESALMMGVNKIRILAAAAAQKAYAAATRDAEAAQAVFNKVAKSNIYVWLAGIILTVVGAIAAFTRGSKEQKEELEKVNVELQHHADILKKITDNYDTLNDTAHRYIEDHIEDLKRQGASTEEIRKAEDELFNERKNALLEERNLYEREMVLYPKIKDALEDNIGKMVSLERERTNAMRNGDTERAQFYQNEINNLNGVMEAQRKSLGLVDNWNKRFSDLMNERKQQEDDRKREDEEASKRAAEAARQRAEQLQREREEMKRNREELKKSTDDLIGYFDSLKKGLKPIPEGEKDFFDQLREKYEAIDKAARESQERQELYARHVKETLGVDILNIDDSIMEKLEREANPLYNFSQTYKENAQAIQETSSALESSFSSLSQMYQQMANDESKTEEERAKAARKARAWAGIQVASNAGAAIAKGVASAVDVGFPAAIPAIATMTATILAAIAQAKALLAEAHEHGGVIGGKFVGATSGSDNVLMTGRRGELVLNAEQQKRLYDIANGSASSNLTASLVEALQAMPAPILDYSEFVRFTRRVVDLDNFVTIK